MPCSGYRSTSVIQTIYNNQGGLTLFYCLTFPKKKLSELKKAASLKTISDPLKIFANPLFIARTFKIILKAKLIKQ